MWNNNTRTRWQEAEITRSGANVCMQNHPTLKLWKSPDFIAEKGKWHDIGMRLKKWHDTKNLVGFFCQRKKTSSWLKTLINFLFAKNYYLSICIQCY